MKKISMEAEFRVYIPFVGPPTMITATTFSSELSMFENSTRSFSFSYNGFVNNMVSKFYIYKKQRNLESVFCDCGKEESKVLCSSAAEIKYRTINSTVTVLLESKVKDTEREDLLTEYMLGCQVIY